MDAKGIMGESRYSEIEYHCSLMRQNEALTWSVWLIWFVLFISLIWLIWLVSLN